MSEEPHYPIDRQGWLTASRPREIYLGDRIRTYPLVMAGEHWMDVHYSIDGSLTAASRFPFVKTIAKYQPYVARKMVGIRPKPGSRGGGYFPVLTKLSDGRLACVFRTGQLHVGSGGEISLSFSSDRGETWTPYQVIVRSGPGRNDDVRDPAFGQAANGDLVIVYGNYPRHDVEGASVPGAPDGWTRLFGIRSSDFGKTWSNPETLELRYDVAELLPGPHGQIRTLRDGTMVLNIRGGRPRRSFFLWSRDNGATWPETTCVGDHTETEFLPLSDEHWLAFARCAMIRQSYDGGRTWTTSQTLASGGHIVPGHPLDLGDGRIVMIMGCRAFPFGIRAILSRDGGGSFELETQYVLCDSFFHVDCGYPSSVVHDDGTIVTAAYCTYDWNHPEWGTCAIAFVYDRSLFPG